MNLTYIKYFLTVAKYLNFSQAADQLYISQPALSRQINVMEKELDLELFIRSNREVKLTPAGSVLVEAFQKIYDEYNLAVAKAQNTHKGMSGDLNIGILDGEYVGDLFPDALQYLNKYYPDLNVVLRNYSFKGLVDRLYNGKLDIAITLYFDIKNRTNIQYRIIDETNKDNLAVIRSHPLASHESVKLYDIKNETLIIDSVEDSEESSKLIIDECRTRGFTPRIQYAPSIQTVMLMVESGLGVAILDSRNALRQNPNIKFLSIDANFEPYLTLAWHQNNQNPARELFTKLFFHEKID
ncbi:LysR family transcriptional regulator [Alkalibacter mobilis]|uniref:LysR family transcriptional regulator n=1 Tax=Alkalibacter mobilis TaxID=2787712 RepID=UPI00189E2A0E|nr:LysR substrate-binding domain-containing protein [Alkalibacter mobilis]MBF7097245.1 LysR family transcriptional regulator [Alkalibacter mobilis]